MKCNNVRNVAIQCGNVNRIASIDISEIIGIRSYNFTLRDIVEEDEVTEHCDEAEKTKSSHNVDHRVLQIKFSCNFFKIQSNIKFI